MKTNIYSKVFIAQKVKSQTLKTLFASAILLTSAVAASAQTQITGSVFNDGNGMKDGFVNGTPISAVWNGAADLPLFVYLINGTTIAGKCQISLNGDYLLNGVSNTSYTIVLTTADVPVGGSVYPNASLPVNWEYVGEAPTNGNNGVVNGVISFSTNSIPYLPNYNFGINRKPVSQNVTLVNPTIDAQGRYEVAASSFDGSDAEDGNYTTSTTRSLRLYQGTHVSVYYNNTAVAFPSNGGGVKIDTFDATKVTLQLDPGQSTGYFNFSAIDAAGTEQLSNSTISLPAPLAIRLGDFSGRWQNSGTQLTWVTTAEMGTKYFDVERSTDGRNFSAVGRINSQSANGYSDLTHTYKLVDEASSVLNVTRIYYRLKEVDFKGVETFSKVIAVSKDGKTVGADVKVYPNPATTSVATTLVLDQPQNVSVRLINMLGAVVAEQNFAAGDVAINANFSLANIPNGIYTIQAKGDAGMSAAQNVVVKKN